SYVYMKALEKKAEKYDKGIRYLTLGRLPKIKRYISDNLISKNDTVLDIGMGTGTFLILCANKGAIATGIDNSEKMLEVAKRNIKQKRLTENIRVIKMSVIELDENFSEKSFDKITAILTFSELYQDEQDFCLKNINRILKDNGEFILVDEVKPRKIWKKILYFIIRNPLVIITYLKSQLTTKYLKNIEKRLEDHNFSLIEEKSFLLDSLKLLRLKKSIKK
ncbi:MAG: corrinoid protein-associated methyltransferase CpaM, partial [Candidatus Heimdallarchaeota archaeon]